VTSNGYGVFIGIARTLSVLTGAAFAGLLLRATLPAWRQLGAAERWLAATLFVYSANVTVFTAAVPDLDHVHPVADQRRIPGQFPRRPPLHLLRPKGPTTMSASVFHAIATQFRARYLSPLQFPGSHRSVEDRVSDLENRNGVQPSNSRIKVRAKAQDSTAEPKPGTDAHFDHVMARSADALKRTSYEPRATSRTPPTRCA
jgi:hypothetical protein